MFLLSPPGSGPSRFNEVRASNTYIPHNKFAIVPPFRDPTCPGISVFPDQIVGGAGGARLLPLSAFT